MDTWDVCVSGSGSGGGAGLSSALPCQTPEPSAGILGQPQGRRCQVCSELLPVWSAPLIKLHKNPKPKPGEQPRWREAKNQGEEALRDELLQQDQPSELMQMSLF